VRRQAVGSTYEPKTDDDPALILAMAAYQLGRQAAESLHPAKPRSPEPAPDQDRRSPEPGDARVVGARTWVQPVFGAWGEVSVGEMDASYTRFTAGPRSRKGAQVREHLRRAKGTSADARPTIKVSSHYRHGTGPGASAPTPVVTRVSEKKRLWS
jgi:hypothetical protein